jgi:hypothetical protein
MERAYFVIAFLFSLGASMISKTGIKILVSLVGVIATGCIPSSAFAQSNCPTDMKEVRVGKAVSCVPEKENVTWAKQQLQTDPKYAELLQGKWFFIQPQNARKGEFCGIVFQKIDGMIAIIGPGGDYRGALLRFYGVDIPKSAGAENGAFIKQKVTLTQAPDPAKTLQVLNTSYQGIKFGVLSIPIPSVEAAIDSMVDEQAFKIEIDGHVVFSSQWHSGLNARDELRKCVQAK